MDVHENMKKQGITLPEAPAKGGLYSPCKQFSGHLYYVSGCGPAIGDEKWIGKLGRDLDVNEGQIAARNCMLNVLAALQAKIGDLNRVKRVVKITTFVASDDECYDQPEVADGGTRLLAEVFGEAIGLPSRSAVGMNVLPGNIAVETEALFEVSETDS